ncbi:MAG: hypothetical protein EXR71_19650 [Myxococcales bacterium]|nr:hypothetical protein [Myxococcales bacterium]
MAVASRRRLLAGLGALAATAALRPAHAAFPTEVRTSGGTLTSPLGASNADHRPTSRGGYIEGGEPSFTLRNARILIGDGTEVAGGIRVERGEIVEVGPGVTSGEDLSGAVVFPGFFDGGSTIGLMEIDLEPATHDESESVDAVVTAARIEDAYNPESALLPVARRQGVLGGLVLPTGGLVSGQGAWMRFAGERVSEATMLGGAGLVIHFGNGGTGALPNQPKSRMGVALKLRELIEANKAPDPPDPKAKKKKKGDEDKPDEITRSQKAWHAVRARQLKVILEADRADDILSAIAFATEFSLDAVLAGCAEGHLVANDIAASGFTVLLAATSTQPSDWETLNAAYENPARLHAAGVRFVFRAGGPHNLRELPTEACIAVAHGLPFGAAIAAACGNHASLTWQLPIGALSLGRPATLVIADGDPLQPRTRMRRAWIAGREVSLRSRQSTLFERFRTLW